MKEETSAARKLGEEKARELIRGASRVIVMKGRQVTTFDMKDGPDEAEMLAAMLGTTGNLRAPTVVRGKTVLVGFNEEIYGEVFG
ncbi:hypothetical protein KDM41_02365 [bacterium]|nr:hypothetical protein [bacterium]